MNFEKLQYLVSLPESDRPRAVMGFDGYVDTVSRLAADVRSSYPDMVSFGQFLAGRQERSSALALDRRFRRFGGNMPICASALAALGIPVSCIGAMGSGTTSHVFSEMHERCTLHPVAEPGECLALEFAESKLFFADHKGVGDMNWQCIESAVGLDSITAMMGEAALIGLFNWGELPNMHDIWENLLRRVMPSLPGTDRWILFDLSDCSGRSAGELQAVMSLMGEYRRHGRVVLSVNDNELMTLANTAPAIAISDQNFKNAGRILSTWNIADILVHHGGSSASVYMGDAGRTAQGEWVDDPSILTGGGDHFNAGLALGLLAGFDPLESAMVGNRVSHCYVRDGTSPLFEDLALQVLDISL